MRLPTSSPGTRQVAAPFLLWSIGLVCAGILVALPQITRSIREGDESIHTVIAQQLAFQDGPSLIPRLRGLMYAQKPPVIHNVIALFLKIFGDHNWVYRIPSMILTCLSCLALHRAAIRMFSGDLRVALLTVTLFLGSSSAFRSSHSLLSATPEPWLFFASTIGLLGGYVVLTQARGRVTAAALLPLSIALGTMAKWSAGLFAIIPIGTLMLGRLLGPVLRQTGLIPTVLFPDKEESQGVGCLAAYNDARKAGEGYQSAPFRPWLTPARLFLLLLIGLIPIGSLILVWLWHDPTFFFADVVDNTAQRLIVKGFHHQTEPLLYVKTFVKGAYLAIPILLVGALGFFRVISVKKHPHRFSFLFLAIWWLIPLALFSFLKSRNAWYYLPAIPGLILFSAGGMVHVFDLLKSSVSRGVFIMSLGVFSVYLIGSNSELLGKRRLSELDKLVSGITSSGQTVSLYPALETLEKRSPSALTLRELLYLKRLLYGLPQSPDADIVVRVIGKGDSVVAQYPTRDRKCVKERKFSSRGRYICFLSARRQRTAPSRESTSTIP